MGGALAIRPTASGRDAAGLVLAIAVCLAAGIVAATATAEDVRTWYPTLAKPPFTPPASLFAPVRTTLYVLMGVCVWLIWRYIPRGPRRTRLLALFAVQLALNALWSIIFFAWRSPPLALVDILLLLSAVSSLSGRLWRTHRPAAVLLFPHLAWTGFAALLDASIVAMN